MTVPLPEISILASDNLAAAANSLLPVESIKALNVVTVIPDRSASKVFSNSVTLIVPDPLIFFPVALAAVIVKVTPEATLYSTPSSSVPVKVESELNDVPTSTLDKSAPPVSPIYVIEPEPFTVFPSSTEAGVFNVILVSKVIAFPVVIVAPSKVTSNVPPFNVNAVAGKLPVNVISADVLTAVVPVVVTFTKTASASPFRVLIVILPAPFIFLPVILAAVD